jgi:alcohol dehydrogenase class IV
MAVNSLLARLEFPVLSSLGVNESHLDTLAAIALEDFFHTQSAVPWSLEELRRAFAGALAEESRSATASTHP